MYSYILFMQAAEILGSKRVKLNHKLIQVNKVGEKWESVFEVNGKQTKVMSYFKKH